MFCENHQLRPDSRVKGVPLIEQQITYDNQDTAAQENFSAFWPSIRMSHYLRVLFIKRMCIDSQPLCPNYFVPNLLGGRSRQRLVQ